MPPVSVVSPEPPLSSVCADVDDDVICAARPVVVVFSGVDSRVESHPNPVYPEDAAFFEDLGFRATRATVWRGKAFWLGECLMTEYARMVTKGAAKT